MPWWLLHMYTRSERARYLHLQGPAIQREWLIFSAAPEAFPGLIEFWGQSNSFLRNNGKCLPVDKAQHPIRIESSAPVQDPQILGVHR
jgi:hypothetical protein